MCMCACVCLGVSVCVVPGKVCVVLVLWKKAYCHWGWKPCIPGSEIIATLSLLIVVTLGLCKVWIGLSGNSIHIQLQPWAPIYPRILAIQWSTHTHTHTHTHTQHVQNKYIHTYTLTH